MTKDEIEQEKKQYVDMVKRQAIGKKILIYGAGKVGQSIFRVLKDAGISVFSFCVTDNTINKRSELGVPVHTLLELQQMNDMIILVNCKCKLNTNLIKKHYQ